MAGRYGNELVTIVGLEVLYIDQEKNWIFVKGAVPGRSGSIVKLKATSRNKKSASEPFKILRYENN